MKIRIAVAVGFDDDGKPTFQAQGHTDDDDWSSLMEGFELLDGERRFWITAEVPDPVALIPEIAGEVELAEAEA